MEPSEFEVIESMARKRRSSVSDLMREAARVHLLASVDRSSRVAASEAFLRLPDTKLPEWKRLKRDLETRRG
ncbi:MAG: ribbon-helix-helix protein, CopG family [Deltaproteobacteria bacterium]|nr:ribbon-helix-helix protein, CopG family [Deltaproteobacteria bacterium]